MCLVSLKFLSFMNRMNSLLLMVSSLVVIFCLWWMVLRLVFEGWPFFLMVSFGRNLYWFIMGAQLDLDFETGAALSWVLGERVVVLL